MEAGALGELQGIARFKLHEGKKRRSLGAVSPPPTGSCPRNGERRRNAELINVRVGKLVETQVYCDAGA